MKIFAIIMMIVSLICIVFCAVALVICDLTPIMTATYVLLLMTNIINFNSGVTMLRDRV